MRPARAESYGRPMIMCIRSFVIKSSRTIVVRTVRIQLLNIQWTIVIRRGNFLLQKFEIMSSEILIIDKTLFELVPEIVSIGKQVFKFLPFLIRVFYDFFNKNSVCKMRKIVVEFKTIFAGANGLIGSAI